MTHEQNQMFQIESYAKLRIFLAICLCKEYATVLLTKQPYLNLEDLS